MTAPSHIHEINRTVRWNATTALKFRGGGLERSETGAPARAEDGRFVYTRDADQFEQVMAYFWINQAQEYLQSLGFGASHEAGAIGEGFADYLAVTVGLAAAQQYGWPVNAPAPCVADWDAVSYTSTVPHCLRRVDGTKTVADMVGSVHRDGEIWSRALWDIRSALGAGIADRIIVEAQFDFAPNTSFRDAALAAIATAQRMSGTTAANTVRAAFQARAIV